MPVSPLTELSFPRLPEPVDQTSRAIGPTSAVAGSEVADTGGASFGDIFGKAIDAANHADAFASQKVDALARGVGDDLHGTMIAVKEADISVKLVATIRNKLLDAFNDLWKTSV